MKTDYILLILLITVLYIFQEKSKVQNYLEYQSSRFIFDPLVSRQSVYLSLISNCKIENIDSWQCGELCEKFPNMVDAKGFYNSSHSGQGYVGYDTSLNLIVIAVRGSKDWKNWLTDFQFWKLDYPLCEGCQVEAGFFHNYQDLEDLIINHTKFLKAKYPSAQALLTGHSLGASTVIVASLFIQQIVPIKMIQTYGCPRTGNQAFIDYFNKQMANTQVWRVINYHDPVPHLPLQQMKFKQYNTEVWYNSNDNTNIYAYDVCFLEEAPYCSDSVKTTQYNPDNHNHYLGVYMSASC